MDRLEAIGVDEIACLLDFGPAANDVLAQLPLLKALTDAASRQIVSGRRPLQPLTFAPRHSACRRGLRDRLAGGADHAASSASRGDGSGVVVDERTRAGRLLSDRFRAGGSGAQR